MNVKVPRELQELVDVALEKMVMEGQLTTTWNKQTGQREYHLAEWPDGILYGD